MPVRRPGFEVRPLRRAVSLVLSMGMHARRALAALALTLVALACTSGVAAAKGAAPAGQRSSLLAGVNIAPVSPSSEPAEADRAITEVQALGAQVVRLDVPWWVFEPHDAQHISPRPQAYLDRLVADAQAAGIRLITTVESSPCWASSAPRGLLAACRPTKATKANSWPPRNASDYAAFAAYLAARYGSALAAIEIWNEPDQANEFYFAGPHKAARYATVLRAAYPAIKRANPAVQVLAGSLVGSNGAFLRALYAAGIKGFYDGLSVHFYNLTIASLRSIHQTQAAAGDRTPLWLNEFGWSSCWPHQRIQQEQACVTPGIQALNLADTVRALARTPYVRAAVVYKLQDSGAEDFGLLSAGGARKAAFRSFAGALRSAGASVSPVRLTLRRRGASVVASGSAPVGDFMLLEAFQGATLRYRAVFILDRFNRFSITLPSVLGTSGLRVRVFEAGAGAAHAAQKSI